MCNSITNYFHIIAINDIKIKRQWRIHASFANAQNKNKAEKDNIDSRGDKMFIFIYMLKDI